MDKITKQLYETWAKIISEQMGQYSDQDATYNRTQGGGFGGGRPMPKPLPKPEPYPIPEPLPKPRPLPFPFPKPEPKPIPGIEPRPLPFPLPKPIREIEPTPKPTPGYEPRFKSEPSPFPYPKYIGDGDGKYLAPTTTGSGLLSIMPETSKDLLSIIPKTNKNIFSFGLNSIQKMYEERDTEGQMAIGELKVLAQKAQELANMMKDDTQLEAWVQSKITKAKDYISSVHDYMNGKPDKVD